LAIDATPVTSIIGIEIDADRQAACPPGKHWIHVC